MDKSVYKSSKERLITMRKRHFESKNRGISKQYTQCIVDEYLRFVIRQEAGQEYMQRIIDEYFRKD
ncbi:hypothetical protein [Thermoanaerobacterium sp. RBIITD]|uniref:hypothetical protein n=1 Tax=Thermoanaerobacterium sp. RBIITD TaxID=1550240 RepID=UPI000BB7F9B4|nr:hypothetical protein [Thermoanaerobacterium sp. RBIITD]SNX54058.1 hypothetical protein SAMN05660242_1689 [Thermoanaerobacterium sp. RBIITD]